MPPPLSRGGLGMPGHPELDAGGPMRRKMVGLATEGRYFWTNVLCQAAVNLCSKALLFLKYRALLVQRGPARLARGASHPGCGSQRLLRCRLHPAGRGPNSSSLFPPLAAVVAVAPCRRGLGSPRKVNGFARGSPTRGNNDDRRQRRKQGVAVGAAASKTQAKRRGCRVPQPGCEAPLA